MKLFDFSDQIIETVMKELESAEEYIKVAVFQIHNEEFLDLLGRKAASGIKVEILTLPYDSIHENHNERVVSKFEEIKDLGVSLHFCAWNIGDPERTSTAIGRWYSYHGKFIVTDKCAIGLSANFTTEPELDALIIYRNEYKIIEQFNSKFRELLELFVKEKDGYDGTLREIILAEHHGKKTLFNLPEVIETDTHKDHWVAHYPSSMCPKDIDIKEGLLISPFDVRARNLFESLIKETEEFLYISTESFTDTNISDILIKEKSHINDIKILSGSDSMDFTERIQNQFRELIARDIELKSPKTNLHGKLFITSDILAVSSVNLNKMNLGFKKTSKYWRANTETINICLDKQIIQEAKEKFTCIFNDSINIEEHLTSKIEGYITSLFTSTYNLRSRAEVKTLFARLILNKEIQTIKFAYNLASITAKVMKRYDVSTVDVKHFIMALVIYYLTERKQDRIQLKEKLDVLEIDAEEELSFALHELVLQGLIEQEDTDLYKINSSALFGG